MRETEPGAGRHGAGLAGAARTAADHLEGRADVVGWLLVLDRDDSGGPHSRATGHRGPRQWLLEQRRSRSARRRLWTSDAQADLSRDLSAAPLLSRNPLPCNAAGKSVVTNAAVSASGTNPQQHPRRLAISTIAARTA